MIIAAGVEVRKRDEAPEKLPEALLQLKFVCGSLPCIPARLPTPIVTAPATNEAPISAIWPVKSFPKLTVPRRSTAIEPENVANVSCIFESEASLIVQDPSVIEKVVL